MIRMLAGERPVTSELDGVALTQCPDCGLIKQLPVSIHLIMLFQHGRISVQEAAPHLPAEDQELLTDNPRLPCLHPRRDGLARRIARRLGLARG